MTLRLDRLMIVERGTKTTSQAKWQPIKTCVGGPQPQMPQIECPQLPDKLVIESAANNAATQMDNLSPFCGVIIPPVVAWVDAMNSLKRSVSG